MSVCAPLYIVRTYILDEIQFRLTVRREIAYGVADERVRDAHEWNEERALRDEQLGGVRLVPLDEVEVALEPGRARTLAVLAAAAASGHCNAEAAEAERCEDWRQTRNIGIWFATRRV